VRVQRYREATADLLLPDDVRKCAAVRRRGQSFRRALPRRRPLATDDVIEASRTIDVAVIEAWLVERADPFTLDAKRLVALARRRRPSRVIDLMVALSYRRPSRSTLRLAKASDWSAARGGGGRIWHAPTTYFLGYDPLCSSYYLMMDQYAYGCGGRYGMGTSMGMAMGMAILRRSSSLAGRQQLPAAWPVVNGQDTPRR